MTSHKTPVLVTGGSSGLGAAVVAALAARGRPVAVLDRNPPRAEVPWIEVDLADFRAAETAVGEVVERLGPLGGLVGAAGIDACGPLAAVEPADWERVVAVNLVGAVAVVRAALPGLRETGGRIVNVASTLALRPLGHATAYCASKAALLAFDRALAVEEAGRVGVTTLIPGGMQTAFFDGRPDEYRPGPDAHLNDPANVAGAVVFALDQPPGCELRELVLCPATEPSWP